MVDAADGPTHGYCSRRGPWNNIPVSVTEILQHWREKVASQTRKRLISTHLLEEETMTSFSNIPVTTCVRHVHKQISSAYSARKFYYFWASCVNPD